MPTLTVWIAGVEYAELAELEPVAAASVKLAPYSEFNKLLMASR